MGLEEKMFSEVELWLNSKQKKSDFLLGKDYTEGKFNYWLSKWRLYKNSGAENIPIFSELTSVYSPEIKLGKVLEIVAPSGVRITVFA
jgi:hypothetical protein